MSDTSDHKPDLDVEAEKEHLEELEHKIQAAREKAKDDLEVGGEGRPFADEGVRESVEKRGDVEYPGD